MTGKFVTFFKFFIFSFVAFFISSCDIPPYDAEEARASFASEQPTPHNITIGKKNFHFVTFGNPNNPALTFIHGSPGGGWELWSDFMKDPDIIDRFFIIVVDRWGFGRSDFGNHEPSLEKQAYPIAQAIKQHAKDERSIIVGHSYGGPVQFRLGMDHPEVVAGQISLAPSVAPKLEKPKWYNLFAQWKVIQIFLPELLVISNREIMPLDKELKAIEHRWDKLYGRIVVIHGDHDRLVDVGNAFFVEKKAINANVEKIIINKGNHFLPWRNYDTIKKSILSFTNH